MKKAGNWLLIIIGSAAVILGLFMLVQAVMALEYGRFVFYLTIAFIGGALCLVGAFRLKNP